MEGRMFNPSLFELDNKPEEIIKTEEVTKVEDAKIIEAKEKCKDLFDKYCVNLSAKYGELAYVLEINGIKTFPKGDIQVVKAKAKQGKTHVIICIITALLQGEFLTITSKIEHPKVCYFATEEHIRSVQRLVRKVHKLCRWPTDENDENLLAYSLRTMNLDERANYIKDRIEEEKPDIVFIDGIRDLLHDFNNIQESSKLVGFLMRLSEEADCAIVNVIHTNKSYSDSNMRGHLGTELLNKCSDVLEVEKKANVINVEETDCRNIATGKWAFTFDDEGLPVKAEITDNGNKSLSKSEKRLEKINRDFSEVLADGENLSYTELRKRYMSVSNVKIDAANKHIIEMTDLNFLKKNEDGKYQLR